MLYEFEMWVMAHSAGVGVVLGTDFMIPAGIRLDLFHGAAQLPNEIRIPLVKTKNMLDREEYGSHVNAGPSEQMDIPGHEWRVSAVKAASGVGETYFVGATDEEDYPVSNEISTRSAAADQANQRLRPGGVLPGARRRSSVSTSG
ncbi:hypothetical protein PC119_g26679 [Phytophthora cactorum]|nr:hypothetical protein PC119_g26679 [Phytophthora cactorum]